MEKIDATEKRIDEIGLEIAQFQNTVPIPEYKIQELKQERIHLEQRVQHLREDLKHQREDLKQLRRKEEQLREKELFLLKQQKENSEQGITRAHVYGDSLYFYSILSEM